MKNTAETRLFMLLCIVCLACLGLPAGRADEEALQNPVLKRLYSDLRDLFRRHCPKSTSHLLKDKIHFEHDTRIFIVHEPTKNGEWQDPWEERGPKLGGILCDLELQNGRYKVWFTAPYSAKHDAHLLVHLSYPRNVDEEFLKQFTDFVNDFAKYID